MIKTKKSDSYSTDEWLYSIFDDWFDPCILSKGELRQFDGLGSSWGEKTFVNPPYSNPKKWVLKAIEESKKGKLIVMLLKMDTSTDWFRLLQENEAKFLWIYKRLKFRTGKPSQFPCMLAILKK